MKCPPARELTRFVDGELTENRAADVRAHLGRCSRCSGDVEASRRLVARIAAPWPGAPSDDALAAVMRRVTVGASPPPRRFGAPFSWRVLGGLAAVATVATAVLAVRPSDPSPRAAFAPRGATVPWARKIGVDLWALEGPPRRLAAGDHLAPGVAVVASFSNVDPAAAWLLVFAEDARGEVHWLYPAYTETGTDPGSIRLDGSVVQRALPESVVLEDVPAGPLRFVVVVSREPLRVSAVERATPPERTAAALRARWPDARIDERSVTFGFPPAAP